jgi:hypothetical protein
MFTITVDSPAAHLYGYSILMALGVGLDFNIGIAIAGIKMGAEGGSVLDVNSVVVMQNISQLGGILTALLIAGQVFQSVGFEKLNAVLGDRGFY